MGNIGPMELILIAFVILLLFGAGRIASVGKGFGQAIREFREGVREDPPADKGT
jgi:sec-independent protein translocase protein TatA